MEVRLQGGGLGLELLLAEASNSPPNLHTEQMKGILKETVNFHIFSGDTLNSSLYSFHSYQDTSKPVSN